MTTPIDTRELTEDERTALLRRLLDSATPGPWGLVPPKGEGSHSGGVYGPAGVVFDDGSADGEYEQKCIEADRDAMIALRSAAPALLGAADEVEKLRATNAGLNATNVVLLHERDRLRAEVTRLREALRAEVDCPDTGPACEAHYSPDAEQDCRRCASATTEKKP
jgi:hypothetical protein